MAVAVAVAAAAVAVAAAAAAAGLIKIIAGAKSLHTRLLSAAAAAAIARLAPVGPK